MRSLEAVLPIKKLPREVLCIEELDGLIEEPLLAACRLLFEMNIRSYMSSANLLHVQSGKPAWIMIEVGSLSETNKVIAKRVCRIASNERYALLEVPIPNDFETDALSDKIAALVRCFEPEAQPGPWLFRLEDLRDIFELYFENEYDEPPVTYFLGIGFIYDESTGLFTHPF